MFESARLITSPLSALAPFGTGARAGAATRMVFNSLTFLVFLVVVLGLYYRLAHRAQNLMLLAASYLFYGWWNWRFLGLLLFSTVFDYYCAIKIEEAHSSPKRKLYLTFSILVNMGILCAFKYYNFFAQSLETILKAFHFQPDFPTLHVILPIGISFYTFLSMSYTIDVFRGELKATRHPTDFMLYVAFFPHLVAGPIVRAAYLLPQCALPRVIQRREVENGLWLILMGYVKKVVIADRLAAIANFGFSGERPPFADWNAWIPILAFAFQIYGDFAGYSDIARGLSKLMGFELTINFRAPYLVSGPSEFWQHWHISLSTWLRDYLYIPLGGNRHGRWKTYRNLMITMLLGGLWHGAGVAYVLWGLLHGALLACQRVWLEVFPPRSTKPAQTVHLVRACFFFIFTCVGWLLFRAGGMPPGVDQWVVVTNYLNAMFTPRGISAISGLAWPVFFLGALALWFQWHHERMNNFFEWSHGAKTAAIAGAFFAITVLGVFQGTQFIYFQF